MPKNDEIQPLKVNLGLLWCLKHWVEAGKPGQQAEATQHLVRRAWADQTVKHGAAQRIERIAYALDALVEKRGPVCCWPQS